VEIRGIVESDREWVLKQRAPITGIARGRLQQIDGWTGIIAMDVGSPVGLLVYREEGDQIEIVALSELTLHGFAATSLLLCALVERAYAAHHRRLWLVTSNDCYGEICYYGTVGFDITAVRRDALDAARRSELQLPERGWFGIQIRDEIEIERQIVRKGFLRSSPEVGSGTLREDLRILAQSSRLQFGRHGFGQELSPEAKAFHNAIAQRSYSKIQAEWLLEIGTPAGQVYGACLLHTLDSAAGAEAFRRLSDDDAEVTYKATGSCVQLQTTVSRCVEWLIGAYDAGTPGGWPQEATRRPPHMYVEWSQSYARGREEAEAFRLERLARINRLTEQMIKRGAREGSITCPHCGARGSHTVRRPGGERLIHAICKACGRSFMGDDDQASGAPREEALE